MTANLLIIIDFILCKSSSKFGLVLAIFFAFILLYTLANVVTQDTFFRNRIWICSVCKPIKFKKNIKIINKIIAHFNKLIHVILIKLKIDLTVGMKITIFCLIIVRKCAIEINFFNINITWSLFENKLDQSLIINRNNYKIYYLPMPRKFCTYTEINFESLC